MADGQMDHDGGSELIVDLFAGAGGASAGIEDAVRAPDIAINHNPVAIAVHKANHPLARHYMADVFEVEPLEATRGRPVGILWASPDCRHHSKAKGGKPRDKRIRGLAWVIVRWAYATRPRTIFMENVEEFREWGPLDAGNMPIKALRGRTFEAFCAVMSSGLRMDHPDMPEIIAAIGDHVPLSALMRGLGYNVDFKELVAADYRTPTIRKRLYGVMQRDGEPVTWPSPSCFRNPARGQAGWASAAECIDWRDHGSSIFGRKRPLAKASQRRIARGFWRHVVNTDKPFIVPWQHPGQGIPASGYRGDGAAQPIEAASMFLEQANGGFYDGEGRSLAAPVSTIVGSGSQQRLVSAYLVKYYRDGGQLAALDEPMHTLPTKGRMAIVEILQEDPGALPPDLARKARQCARFLHRWLPEHFGQPAGIVLVNGYAVVDITFRMLKPEELKRAQGFREDYILDRGLFFDPQSGREEWRAITKTEQVKLIGNSVCRQVAEALVRANAGASKAIHQPGKRAA